MSLKTSRIGAREGETIRTKRIAVHLADIVAHLSGAGIGVLELQDRLRDFPVLRAHLDGAPVVDGEVGLLVGACVGGEDVDGTAGGDAAIVFTLAADVEIDGEAAVVADVGGAGHSSCGIDGGHGGTAGDEGGVGHGVIWGWD